MGKQSAGNNYLDLIPHTAAEFRVDDHGCVTVCRPRSGSRVFCLFGRLLGKSRMIQIHLDEKGSRVWLEIDGTRTISAIGEAAAVRGGGTGGYADLAEFIETLKRNKLIRLTAR